MLIEFIAFVITRYVYHNALVAQYKSSCLVLSCYRTSFAVPFSVKYLFIFSYFRLF